jgi:GntR family transcriptional repressor for pyruvate dehydrogenase complex
MTRHGRIADDIVRRILSGELGAQGDRLPTERVLAEQYKTGRNYIREALRKVESMGLVETRRSAGTVILDVEKTSNLGLVDFLITDSDGEPNLEFLRGMAEVNPAIFRKCASLAARNRTPEDLALLSELIVQRKATRDSESTTLEINEDISRAIVKASHNEYMHLLYNTLKQSSLALRTYLQSEGVDFEQRQNYLERLILAIEDRDEEVAGILAQNYFASETQALINAELKAVN